MHYKFFSSKLLANKLACDKPCMPDTQWFPQQHLKDFYGDSMSLYFFGHYLIACCNCFVATKILLAGLIVGTVREWCWNLTVLEMHSALVVTIVEQ